MADSDSSSRLRASDADRDRVAQLLGAAHADGRLAAEEYQERLDRLYAGRTLGDLERVSDDLGGAEDLRGAAGSSEVVAAGAPERGGALAVPERVRPQLAILSQTMARPTGRIEGRLVAVSVFGNVQVDLSHATIGPEGVLVTANTVAGAVNITVPADARVTMTGLPLVGSLSPTRDPGPVDGPRVVVKAFAGLGSVTIHRAESETL
ncbi:DUF1707 SHOCT-like domain-containing protein [Microlunatus soli]|nr:DUF1707 domain-containing protein [Microlunatus soli]